ncbi:MAG: D-alanyl-D-alanine carboxypeptidase [Atribacterota bacterium]|nr:D-alanyl-D-alanine carboxypeptidase [Atribacterota bacterium]MDD4896837.1 D-alanyl-D-alanine carboxypeptidase [Atribacterota bacterium]MDD5636926.1 D-alanyl-D-alanine carboxypeptidase [Atribacterota bacterium]
MIKRTILFIITIVIVFSLVSPMISGQSVIEQDIEQFNAFAGILIQDLYSGQILLSHNQDKLFTPASLVKILTLLAALEVIGEEYRFPTFFYFSSTNPGEIQSNLYIKGSGDPTNSPEMIREIAQNFVNKYRIGQINGDLILDDFFFQKEEFLGRGWMWDDQNPLIGALAIKGYSAKEKYISYYDTMTMNWGEIFCSELLRLGIQIKGGIKIDQVKEDVSIKAIHYSDTLDNILVQMMKMSDNQSSEIIFRTLPLMVNSDQAFTIEQSITVLSELFYELFGMQWGEDYLIVDGCGLSEYNLLTPAQIVGFISYLYQKYGREILNFFASTEERGTIKNRFSFPLWAKTGSLPSASGLAGIFQTKSGRNIVFCLMENNFRGEKNNPKLWEDQIINYIYEKY